MTPEQEKQLDAPFYADEIEWRIQQAGKGQKGPWAKCLAYVTNRAIMRRLDEVVGKANWQNHFVAGPAGGVVCCLSIRVDGEWITKEDGADNTEFEPIKGGLSDSMKRAAYEWGIGRYLYDLPEGWAEIHENGQHFSRVRTKDGEDISFRWDPPRLPDWALPKDAAQPPSQREQDPPKQEAPKNGTKQSDDYLLFRKMVVDFVGEEGLAEAMDYVLKEGFFKSKQEMFSSHDKEAFGKAAVAVHQWSAAAVL